MSRARDWVPESASSASETPPEVQTWNYAVLNLEQVPQKIPHTLDLAGAEGWEAVGAWMAEQKITTLLKRPARRQNALEAESDLRRLMDPDMSPRGEPYRDRLPVAGIIGPGLLNSSRRQPDPAPLTPAGAR